MIERAPNGRVMAYRRPAFQPEKRALERTSKYDKLWLGQDGRKKEKLGPPLDDECLALVNYICSGAVSIGSVTSDIWKSTVSQWNLKVPINHRTIVKAIKRHAKSLLLEMHEALWRKPVSIVTDGLTHVGRTFYVILASTAERLYFIDLVEVASSDHVSLVQAIEPKLKELIDNGVILVSVVSDNASNLERTFNPEQLTESLTEFLGKPTLHVHCAVHSVNLVMKDLLDLSPSFAALRQSMMELFAHLRLSAVKAHLRSLGITCKIPKIQEIKWGTFSDAADFLCKHRDAITKTLTAKPMSREFVWDPEWDEIFLALNLFGDMLRAIQADRTRLQDFYETFLQTSEALKGQAGHFPALMHVKLTKRVIRTADGYLAELGYVLTPTGFKWFKQRRTNCGNVLDRPNNDTQFLRVQIDKEMARMRDWFVKLGQLFDFSNDQLGVQFEEYLDGDGPPIDRKLLNYWLSVGNQDLEKFDFSRIAWLLIQVPAHEASAERAFSAFEALFPRVRMAATEELLAAELRIRLEQIYVKCPKSRPK
jgi:hypothetical protein